MKTVKTTTTKQKQELRSFSYTAEAVIKSNVQNSRLHINQEAQSLCQPAQFNMLFSSLNIKEGKRRKTA